MAEEIEYFQLPRTDWYDSEGRIYKDALIENFNAIESKLIEISKLDVFESNIPDISGVDYADVTLDSDSNKIINLRSFLNITGLIGYPLECTFSGLTATKVSYWNSEYKYTTLTDIDVAANSSKPYVYLNYVSGTLTASSSSTTPSNSCCIGFYINGAIKCVNSMDFIGINALYYLSKMSNETTSFTASRMTRDWQTTHKSINRNGRATGTCGTNKKTGTTNNMILRDIGRTTR